MTSTGGAMQACPGCGLEMPRSGAAYDRKFHASAECWSLFEEVIAKEFQNAVLFAQAHQLTVDAYAAQHAGGRHPDKSVCIHLTGLHLALERGLAPLERPRRMQALAARTTWPHFEPPTERASLTICDVALADGPEEHAARVREWAAQVWKIWRPHHGAVRELAKDLD